MSGPPTLLELLLPGAGAASRKVIGSAAPCWLLPPHGVGPADLVIVAPNEAEAGRREWVSEAIRHADGAAAPHGMLYLLLPLMSRPGALRRLRRLGYGTVVPFVHHPDVAQTEHLVPAHRSNLRRWLDSAEGSTPLKRKLAAAALTIPAAESLATAILPGVGVAAFRDAGSLPFGWLARVSGSRVARAQARAKWRGGRGAAVVTGLDASGAPVAIAKIALGGERASGRAAAEAERLGRHGPAARRAGALVPAPKLSALPSGWPVLLLSPMPGRPAASLLAAKERTAASVIASLVEWLERWNVATIVPGQLDDGWIERRLMAPAVVLAEDLPEGYVGWLRAQADAVKGEALPSVATHGDLTMGNVLLDGGPPSVVDWEVAEGDGIPLHDLMYAAVDATAATEGYTDRLGAFERCFPTGGYGAGPLHDALERLRQATGLSEAMATLCLHASWLQHAADERSKRGADEARPFLAIVRRLAEHVAQNGTAP